MDTKSKIVIQNFIWRFAERCGAKGVELLVSIVLARLLIPEVYGQIALVTVFTNILNVFVDSGLGNALVQKKDADEIDFSTVFYFNIFICSVLYVGMFFAAPLIASYYGDLALTSVIRALSLTLVISGVKNVQQAYVSRTMQFRRFFFATLGGTIGAAVIGVILAYLGAGVWALVIQQLFNATVDTIILWLTVKWRPRKEFSLYRLKFLFGYGWKLLVSSLIDNVYNEIRQLIIGKMYSSSSLAYYNRGRQFPSVIVSNTNLALDSVLFPIMSQEQEDCIRVKNMARRAIKISTYIMAPMMMGMAFCAEPIVRLLLTEKWLECIPFLIIFCITFMFYPIHTANLNAIKALGRSDLFLKLEILKKVVGMIALVSTMWFGVMAMAYSLLFTSLCSQIINSWPNKKLLNYGYIEQLKDILPGIGLAVAMGGCIHPVQWLGLPDIVTICIQILLGGSIYLIGSKVFKLESYEYLLAIVKPYVFKKKEQ